MFLFGPEPNGSPLKKMGKTNAGADGSLQNQSWIRGPGEDRENPPMPNFPKLIQDKARASDSLLQAGVRNGEGYVTEFFLVKYGLSKPWTAVELEAGRDQEANEDFAEKIPVLAHMVYEGDDVAAVVRVPSAVRVGTAVTTALVAPLPTEEHPAKARAPEKGPGRIRLKKKATKEVVSAGARTPPEKGDGASRAEAIVRNVGRSCLKRRLNGCA
ncbi:hypothetical protein Taro_030038 [Colocasia esculenta]|uniref:Uncharacterized protein n=1 Tax=Colocasia esculenta TaxID=4460 RepID=A0A843VSY1_COLES|nr:hypothetical protein [Colocasia esculenta]